MNESETLILRSLLLDRPVAALATLHKGEPAVSMVPFACMPMPAGMTVVIHVSRLATHTRDMLEHPSVSLLVTASADAGHSPLALPRVAMQGHARLVDTDSAEHAHARAAYLAKLPDAEPLFGFTDFSLFVVVPQHLRFVAGFGKATTIGAQQLDAVFEARPPASGAR